MDAQTYSWLLPGSCDQLTLKKDVCPDVPQTWFPDALWWRPVLLQTPFHQALGPTTMSWRMHIQLLTFFTGIGTL